MITGITYNGYEIPHGRIRRIEGLDTPPYRVSDSVLAGRSGSRFNNNLADKRAIIVEFLLYKTSMDSYLDERAEIFDAFDPEDGENELVIEIDDDETISLNCVVSDVNLPARAAEMTYANVQVQLIAYDPTIYSEDIHSQSGILAPTGGGATFPLIFPITFATSTTGEATIYNLGNINACPTLTLTGLLTNPLIRNETTGETFQLTYSMGVNDSVVIDMYNRTATLNGATSLLTHIAEGSSWWCLEPGANTIALTTSSTSDTGTLEITWQDTWSAR